MSDDRRDHSSYAEIGSGADIPTGNLPSTSASPEVGPTPVPSRPGSPAILLQEPPKQRERGRVRFNSNSEISDAANRRSSLPLGGGLKSPVFEAFSRHGSPLHSRTNSVTSLLRNTFDGTNEMADTSPERGGGSRGASLSPIRRPRPSVLRNNSFGSVYRGESQVQNIDEEEVTNEKTSSAIRAQERAQRVATAVGTHSSPATPISVNEDAEDYFSPRYMHGGLPVRIDDIPLSDLDRQKYGSGGFENDALEGKKARYASEANDLVRAHTTRKVPANGLLVPAATTPGASGRVTPEAEQAHYEDYVPPPAQYRGGVLTSLLKLYNTQQPGGHSRRSSVADSTFDSQPTTPGSSGMNTPQRKRDKWYNQKNAARSQDTLAGLMQASAILGGTAFPSVTTPTKPTRPTAAPRSKSEQLLDFASGKKRRHDDEFKIKVHIAETLSRQKYILKICEALMNYGAPTHRLEEYMRMTSRVLEIDASFLYIPSCMIVSFNDSASHTSQVKLVRSSQGIDLGRLKDVHEIYKEVIHDCIDTDEALRRLVAVMQADPLYHVWVLVGCYGLASVFVAPFAFEARLIDLPICFLLGSILGILQLIIAPASDLYNNVFEISAAVLTSFLARAFGSLQGGNLFCFSALAQSAIVMILPGYTVLCGSLELQSRSIIAGSVRMFYAIMYSLFLGFGITVGTALYGIIDVNATSATVCTNTINPYYNFLFVPPFTLALGFINKAQPRQLPVMLVISFMGYVVNYFAAKKFPTSVEISAALGAFSVGIAGNLYSRLRHGLAAAALLPAIFVQVPSGLAASGSLLAGLSTADSITNTTSSMNGTILNGTSTVSWIDPVLGLVNATGDLDITSFHNSSSVVTTGLGDPSSADDKTHFASMPWIDAVERAGWARNKHVKVTSSEDLNTIVFNVAYSMIQVAIGITVGLFMSALVVYPFGKRRSGLFSF